MKRITRILAAACLTAACSLTAGAQSSPLQTAIDHLVHNKNVHITGSAHEQGRDKLDSLYSCHTQTAALPYKSSKEKAAADALVTKILTAFEQEAATASHAVCRNRAAAPAADVPAEVVVYYAEGRAPLKVGTGGRNYAIVRHNDPANPAYRRVLGVEWWTEGKGQTICFRHFRVHGAVYNRSTMPEVLLPQNQKKMKLDNIKVIKTMYTGKHDNVDKAVIRALNNHITLFLKQRPTDNELTRLFKELADAPGYSAEIVRKTAGKAVDRKPVAFRKLVTLYPTLSVSGIVLLDENDLYTRSKGPDSRNGVLQIWLK